MRIEMSLRVVVWALASTGVVAAGSAATLVPLSFNDLAQRAEAVLEATVVDAGVVLWRDVRPLPRASWQPDGPLSEGVQAAEGAVKVPVEGGWMLCTVFTLEVHRMLAGRELEHLTITVAGGREGDDEVIVFGLPRLAVGRRYVLFLRPGFADTAEPFVGAEQGVFTVVGQDSEAAQRVVDHAGRTVLGVHDGELVLAPAATSLRRLGPPTPTSGEVPHHGAGCDPVGEGIHAEPMTMAQLAMAVRFAREVQP